MRVNRAGEPANSLAAPAPDFFFKRLRFLTFFQAAPAPDFFPTRLWLRLRLQGAKKNPAAPAPDYWFSKIFFFPQTSKEKIKKKKKKIIVYSTLKTYYFTQRRVTNLQFPYAFYLPAGLRSRLIFWRLQLLSFFFQSAPAPAQAPAPRSQNTRLRLPSPGKTYHHCTQCQASGFWIRTFLTFRIRIQIFR